MNLLTVKELAERLNCSESLVYQIADSGKIAVVRIGTGRGTLRFRPEDVDDYLELCRQEKQAGAPPKKKPRPRLKHINV